MDPETIEDTRAAIKYNGVFSLELDNLRESDLPNITWSGGPKHPQYVAAALKRAALGEVEYLAIRSPGGIPICIGCIDYEKHDAAGYINQLATVNELQGLGLGGRLLVEAEKHIKAHGMQKATLGVEIQNVRAKALYERHGYEVYDREKQSWEEGDKDGNAIMYHADVILMQKSL